MIKDGMLGNWGFPEGAATIMRIVLFHFIIRLGFGYPINFFASILVYFGFLFVVAFLYYLLWSMVDGS
jgi:hypothetical protein